MMAVSEIFRVSPMKFYIPFGPKCCMLSVEAILLASVWTAKWSQHVANNPWSTHELSLGGVPVYYKGRNLYIKLVFSPSAVCLINKMLSVKWVSRLRERP